MMQLEKLVRKNILSLKPYTSARDIYQDGVFLDANENSFGSVINSHVADLNRYPDPHQKEIRNALSDYLKINSSKLFFGVGSDEIIDLVIRIFCKPEKSNVIIPQPTYGMYKVSCDINDVEIKNCNLDFNFDLDVDSILNLVDDETRIVFLCSPNNPTGNLLENDKIKLLAESFTGIIFIDEAYAEFAEDKSFISELNEHKNIIISRTFSKAWGLAAARCGYCIANEFIIDLLFKIKAPYTISKFTSSAVLDALNNVDRKDVFVKNILLEKVRLIDELNSLSKVKNIFPSDANFLLVEMTDAESVFNFLNKNGIRVRMRKDDLRLINCLRITVGNEDENNLLLKTLREFE